MKRVLISHSWDHSESLNRLRDLLVRHEYEYYDHSISAANPLNVNGKAAICAELSHRISQVSTVVCMITEDAHKKNFVNFEMEEAVRQRKRLIGIWPWSRSEAPIPRILEQNAHAIVSFRGTEITDALDGANIRRLPEYRIAEIEDLKTMVAWIVGSASGVAIVGSLAARATIPHINAALAQEGYIVEEVMPLPSTSELLEGIAVGAGIGLLVGLLFESPRLAAFALAGGACVALWKIGRCIRVQQIERPDGFAVRYDLTM